MENHLKKKYNESNILLYNLSKYKSVTGTIGAYQFPQEHLSCLLLGWGEEVFIAVVFVLCVCVCVFVCARARVSHTNTVSADRAL